MANQTLHSPTLESVIMVEEMVAGHSGEYGKHQLWKRLPRKMMYQTYLRILGYLERSHKVLIDSEGKVVWIWNPALLRNLEEADLFV